MNIQQRKEKEQDDFAQVELENLLEQEFFKGYDMGKAEAEKCFKEMIEHILSGDWILDRIYSEYRKHRQLNWCRLAQQKIKLQIKEELTQSFEAGEKK